MEKFFCKLKYLELVKPRESICFITLAKLLGGISVWFTLIDKKYLEPTTF